ncbi:glutaredoxin 3 [Fischerella sp. JS2]|uniref:glutaredoxin 3 n=1 Tax=Fischerella sp. JS2 TaxID=2597771 RepID=UPI0028E43700|nr:glutaredoxin 3 [Fischerella sp. JS2]
MAAKVEIYTWSTCPFCIRAKSLLKKKGVEFIEYSIDGDEAARNKMAQRANGRRSVPQIFIDNVHVGGCDDIYALEARGQLDNLLASSNSV